MKTLLHYKAAIFLAATAIFLLWHATEERLHSVEKVAAAAPSIAAKKVEAKLASSRIPLNPLVATKPEIDASATRLREEQDAKANALKVETVQTAKEVEARLKITQAESMRRYNALKDQLDRIERRQEQYFQTQPLVRRR